MKIIDIVFKPQKSKRQILLLLSNTCGYNIYMGIFQTCVYYYYNYYYYYYYYYYYLT